MAAIGGLINWEGKSYHQVSENLGNGVYYTKTYDASGKTLLNEATVKLAGTTADTWIGALNQKAAQTGQSASAVFANSVQWLSSAEATAAITAARATHVGPSPGATVVSIKTSTTPATSSSSAPSQSGGSSGPVTSTTVAWSDGSFMTYVTWKADTKKDKGDNDNNREPVQNGTLVVGTKLAGVQSVSVAAYAMGTKEAVLAWGDPHVTNISLSDTQVSALSAGVEKFFDDANRGQIAIGSTQSVDFAAPLAPATMEAVYAKSEYAFDVNANFELRLSNGSVVDMTMQQGQTSDGRDFALVDAIDVHSRRNSEDVVTVRKLLDGGPVQVTTDLSSEVLADENSVPQVIEAEGNNFYIGARVFGDDGYRQGNLTVGIDRYGQVNKEAGKLDEKAILTQSIIFLDEELPSIYGRSMTGMLGGDIDPALSLTQNQANLKSASAAQASKYPDASAPALDKVLQAAKVGYAIALGDTLETLPKDEGLNRKEIQQDEREDLLAQTKNLLAGGGLSSSSLDSLVEAVHEARRIKEPKPPAVDVTGSAPGLRSPDGPEQRRPQPPEPKAPTSSWGTTSRNQGDQTMSAPTVSTSSNGLTAISSGTAVVLLKDLRDGGSAVDQVVVTSQNDAQVYGGTIGDTETILTGEWGDPHVRNQVYTGASNTGLTQALNALKIDADDGRIDNLENYNKVVAMLTNAAESGAGGRTAEIMDLQADHVLVNGSMRIAVDVESLNDEVAFAENAKITFADGSEKTITNIWNRTGSDGALGVRESETGDGGTSRGTFVVTSADEMGHQGSTHVFGAAHGSISKYVLDVKGTFRGEYGSAGQFWARDDEVAELGFGSVAFWDRYNRKADDESAERARP